MQAHKADSTMSSHQPTEISGTIFHPWSWWCKSIDPKHEFAGALITISALVLVIACYAWAKINSRRPALLPGPRGLPLVGYLPFLKPDIHRSFTELAQTYGPIMNVQLGRKLCVVISSPGLAKEVLKDHDVTFANRDTTAAALAISHGGSGIGFNSYGPEWRMLRKVAAQEMMSNTVLDSYYELRRREVRQTVRDLYAKMGTPINISNTNFQTILNVVTSMLWGGSLDGDRRRAVMAEFEHVIQKAVELLGIPNVSDLFPVVAWLDLQGVVRRMKRLSEWLDRIFDSVIDQQTRLSGVEEKGKSKDFLQLLLQLKDAEDLKTPLTLDHVKAVLADLVAGATETTSTTVEWAMTKLIENPEIMRKVQEELDEVVGMNDTVEESHWPKLHYMRAVIKETLRLYPPLPFLVPRTPSQPCIVGGYMVPMGARVMVNAWAIQRDPEVWDNPLEFRPERFFSTSSRFDWHGNDFRYIPFGSGRRVCVGITMAERMLMFVLAEMLHSFDWQLPEGTKLDFTEKFGIVLKKTIPLIVIPTPRLSNPNLYA
ncbi:flavonoid 3'-monooxygenase CYP75B137-like [Magnolia sinica]|uniref:flavonoid 3'-monooxygenase CYP75B137-like n=1 Tax=Magnolia sinica TaxID=86752 RepID=UPI00265A1E18|nr:flavonoid 3'-monooxygenase CYP75B137-like [Magnolia sinica]